MDSLRKKYTENDGWGKPQTLRLGKKIQERLEMYRWGKAPPHWLSHIHTSMDMTFTVYCLLPTL